VLTQDKPISSKSESPKSAHSGPTMDVYSGVRWSAVARYSTQLIDVTVSIIVARIVAPEAYGLLGMAVIMTGFLSVFQSLGFGAAVIQRKEVREPLLSSLFFVNAVICCAMALLLVAGAPLVSWVYGDARVGRIVATLSLTFVLSAPAIVPSALLNRRLAFRRLAWVDISTSVVKGLAVIPLAQAGWGVSALVWSSIIGEAVRTTLTYVVSDWRPQWSFSWQEVRSVLGFGTNVTFFSMFTYLTRNADNFLIGVFVGATPLGYYSLAYRILLFPRDAITNVITRVLFPAFSRMQHDDVRLKSAYLRACGAIALTAFPMMMGFLAVAQLFVTVVLGPNWLPAVPLICILVPLGMLQSVVLPVGQLFLAKGRADLLLWWGVSRGVLTVLGFMLGIPWGATGVATAYVITSLVLLGPTLSLPFKLVDRLTFRDFFATLIPHAATSGGMTLIVVLCRLVLQYLGCSEPLVLTACVAVGVASYVTIVLARPPDAMSDFIRLLPGRCRSLLPQRYLELLDIAAPGHGTT
jgi:O-antigen/teichoic acid export membrane protein